MSLLVTKNSSSMILEEKLCKQIEDDKPFLLKPNLLLSKKT